jgi:tetratricopeptide (TPR) repeat protein
MNCMFKYACFITLLLSDLAGICQNHKIDSLKQLVKIQIADTNKVNALNSLTCELKNIGQLDLAFDYARVSELLCIELNYNRGLAAVYLNQGLINFYREKYPNALECQFKSLKISEKLDYKKGMANALNNIGNIYLQQNNLEKALECHTKSLGLRGEYLPNGSQVGDTNAIATSLSKIGVIYYRTSNYDLKALSLITFTNDKDVEASFLSHIGNALEAQEKFDEAAEYYTKALTIYKEIDSKSGIALSFYNLGNVFLENKNYTEAEQHYFKSLSIALDIKNLNWIKDANFGLSLVYQQKNDPKKALFYYKEFLSARNNIFNEENTKKTVQSEMNYEFEKKAEAARLEQEKREAIAYAEKNKQNAIIWIICGILILVFVFAIFVYRSFLQKQRINIEITRQKHMIEEKQKEILDSIHYAKRIQTALLTSEKYIERNLNKLEK